MLGPWTPSPVALRADAIAWIDPVCRDESTNKGFETAIGALPLVVVDGRGDGVVTAIFASENRFAACRAMYDETGGAAFETDPVKPVLAAVGNEHLTVVELATRQSLRTDRTFVVGRVVDTAATVRVRLSNAVELDASIANRWFAAWWPGAAAATEISALDRQGKRLGSVLP